MGGESGLEKVTVWWLVNCLGKDGIPVQLARAAWQGARPKLQGRLSSCPAQVEEPLSASTPVTYPGASYPPVSSTNSWSGEVSKAKKKTFKNTYKYIP